MAARTLDAILADINAKTDPQRNLVLNQIADIPKQQAAEEAGLKAQEAQGYTDIVDGARRRGLGFSGIPLGEQAQYHATQYLPAVARMKQGFTEKGTTLQSALAGLDANNYSQANQIYGQEQSLAEQQRQFDLNYALQKQQAAAAAASSGSSLANLFGGGGGGNTSGSPQPSEQDMLKASLQSYLQRQYSANPKATRTQQDNWVRSWANQLGVGQINQAGDPLGLWAYYNSLYPYAKYNNPAPQQTGLRVTNTPTQQLRVV